MAVVHQYIIIYFTLIVHVHYSMSSFINRNLCLETFGRFIKNEDKCNFDLGDAQDILQDVTTCPTKCNFRMNNLDDGSYSLRSIDLTIGNENVLLTVCSESRSKSNIQLYINCSSWNARNLELNDSCELTEQCLQPFSVCLDGKCICVNGYSAFDSKSCLKDNVPVGGFCSYHEQCTGSNNSGVCERGRCTCTEGFTFIDLECKKDTVPVGGFCSLHEQCTGSNNSGVCEHGRCTCTKGFTFIDLACEKNTDIGVTLGTLFGGFILGVIVTAVVTTLAYRMLKVRTRKRKEPDVMFDENRECGTAGGARISFTNNKKQNVAKLSPYSFSKETEGYDLSRKQEDERTEDVYNHLHEQTEQDVDNYDHACAAPNHSPDLSDYSNLRDTATVQPTSPLKNGDDYSTLRH